MIKYEYGVTSTTVLVFGRDEEIISPPFYYVTNNGASCFCPETSWKSLKAVRFHCLLRTLLSSYRYAAMTVNFPGFIYSTVAHDLGLKGGGLHPFNRI